MAIDVSDVASMGGYFANIYEDAVFTLREQSLATRLVKLFTDGRGDQTRTLTVYPTVTPATVEENEDFARPTEFTKTLLAQLSVEEKMSQVIISDRRIETDPQNVRQDAAIEMGGGMAQLVDQDIFSNFNALTGGTIGASGSTMTWAYFFAAVSRMRNANIPYPWHCVLHPYHWHDLAAAVAPSQTVTNAPEFQDEVMRQWFVSRVGPVNIWTSSNVEDSSTDAYGAIFNPNALAFDLRRDARLEPERDASLRAYELNLTMLYAHGVWRPNWGFTILADVSTPS